MAELSYLLKFKGAASPTVQCAFANCEVDTGSGATIVRCPHSDLSNVIAQIRDLGLELLAVYLVADRSSGS